MKTISRTCLAAGLAAFIAGSAVLGAMAAEKIAVAAPQQKTEKQASVKKILFFMNPNGRPCQLQDEIIGATRDSLVNNETVVYYRTTEQKNRNMFAKWGIRGLPSLIIVDGNGRELKRFTPGIQSAESILDALRERAE